MGAQCIGKEGVVKVIDTIATFIQMESNITDLINAELCYSPQHGSAANPINIIGQIGENVMNNLMTLIFLLLLVMCQIFIKKYWMNCCPF